MERVRRREIEAHGEIQGVREGYIGRDREKEREREQKEKKRKG